MCLHGVRWTAFCAKTAGKICIAVSVTMAFSVRLFILDMMFFHLSSQSSLSLHLSISLSLYLISPSLSLFLPLLLTVCERVSSQTIFANHWPTLEWSWCGFMQFMQLKPSQSHTHTHTQEMKEEQDKFGAASSYTYVYAVMAAVTCRRLPSLRQRARWTATQSKTFNCCHKGK